MPVSRHLYAITGLITLLSAIGLSSTHFHSANLARVSQPQSVLVMNTSAQPVPTVAQGTTAVSGTVAVSSLPSVQIATGQNVGITGTPSVNIAAGQSVGISNTGANPVPVEMNTSHVPIRVQSSFLINDGDVSNVDLGIYTVPSGQRLVIQTIFGTSALPPGQKLVSGEINTYPVPFADRGAGGGFEHCDGIAQVDLFLDGSSVVNLSAVRSDSSGPSVVVIGFSGYLEPM